MKVGGKSALPCCFQNKQNQFFSALISFPFMKSGKSQSLIVSSATLSAFFPVVLHLASQVKERGKLKSPGSSTVTRLSRLKGSSFLVVRFPTGILSPIYS